MPEVLFSPSDEGTKPVWIKPRANTLTDGTNEVNKEFIIYSWFVSLSLLTKFCAREVAENINRLGFTYYFVFFCIYSSSFQLNIIVEKI